MFVALRPSMRNVESTPARIKAPSVEPMMTSTSVNAFPLPKIRRVDRIEARDRRSSGVIEVVMDAVTRIVCGVGTGKRAAVVAFPGHGVGELDEVGIAADGADGASEREPAADFWVAREARVDGQRGGAGHVSGDGRPILHAHLLHFRRHDLAG